ncbi:3-demethylubiquinone-9 3-methyltransferase [Pseudoalteromonas luteoviolacea]|nr:3-demethylubiquinone-9 3-methyltransferase [Pseudoalteromonas luteoviolacea]
MKLSFHVNFDGRCAEAFSFYEEKVGGIIGSLLAYKDSPLKGSVPIDWQGKIIHGVISIDNFELVGTDSVPEEYEQPKGFCLQLRLPSNEQVETLFEAFKEEGQVILPPQKTFWSPCYAIVNDRFGIPWKFNCVP